MDINDFLDLKTLIAAAGGAALHKWWSYLVGGIKVLEYTVEHRKVADGEIDQRFPGIAISWNGSQVANLWVSQVDLRNTTSSDLDNLRFRVYTGNSPLLLNDETRMMGEPEIIRYTDEFVEKIRVPPGQNPTEEQWKAFTHEREFNIPVFNRGQHARLTFLTTVPKDTKSSGVWLTVGRIGFTAKHVPIAPRQFGAPVKAANYVGLAVIVAATAALLWFNVDYRIVGPVCLVAGLMVTPIGAYVFRCLALMRKIAKA